MDRDSINKKMIFPLFLLSSFLHPARTGDCYKGGEHMICLPDNYQKYDLPLHQDAVRVYIEVHIKDIPKVSDQDFSITLDAYFNVKWEDRRLQSAMFSNLTHRSGLRQERTQRRKDKFSMTAVNVNILPKLWIPDLEIMDLMSFQTHEILSKLEGVWIDSNYEVMYALASKITFICQMDFNAFPVDIQVCKFRVGSFNYPMNKIVFYNELIPEDTIIKSILDYRISFKPLRSVDKHYMALGMNYSTAGFELILTRKMSFYIITYYLPSGLFVGISWVSFLINPEVIPGRMTMLVTLFLVLINIHNTIQTNSPKADGFTAIKSWVIACIVFVFGAMLEYSGILLLLKLEKMNIKPLQAYFQVHCSRSTTSSQRFTRTDFTFFCVFPLLFLVFNLIYWWSVFSWRAATWDLYYNNQQPVVLEPGD